jgi:DNA-binding FadR family transcriptional regulator
MINHKILSDKQRGLLDYLINKAKNPKGEIPTINKISSDLGISAACLREQMELAKNLGIISAQPHKGIKLLPYEFKSAIEKSLYYAIALDKSYFHQFSEMRNHLEKSYFIESAQLLDEDSIKGLKALVNQAQGKLRSYPVQIPHQEHRNYHLSIYALHNNIFLKGFLESYWDMYEQEGMDLYNDLDYLVKVWEYHQHIVEKIELKAFESAFQLLATHMELIDTRE